MLQAIITQTSLCTWICKKKKKRKWKKKKLGTHRALNLWYADLCLSCFEPVSHRHSRAASWSGVQEATRCICPQTLWDFPHATDCLLLLHQLIRADNFLTQIVVQTHAKKLNKKITFQSDNQKYKYIFYKETFFIQYLSIYFCFYRHNN